ncbi:hypothetical protein PHAVU_009G196300 [Phaseolus vulgaris]|uniref:ENTH domain-containing protein n=1 Tax=Phaseolus vulgaris TaxID=3885 RepID=V7B094_PHAVU|nr:hypothetical protein PHAVU_009G196300g [Phaseolus vulgaris]ESW10288.1 hypothetical protein PHAVU_009G196300g [Phaseolus vulgaris]
MFNNHARIVSFHLFLLNKAIFHSLSPSKPRNEVIYCIHGLTKRFCQTNNWAVAMKTLIVLHRAIRELDSTVLEEFVNYSNVKGCMIDLTYFHEKSVPNDYSIWIRNYARYLEERLQCFAVMNYDAATNSSKYSEKLDTVELLEQLPALQQLLSRLLDCSPRGVAASNRLILFAISMVAGESVKLYVAITVRVVELLDKFFEMYRNDACSSLQIYKKSVSQAERLTDFFETCKGLEFGRGKKFINIKMPPSSFITTMEEYIKEAPSSLMIEYNMDENGEEVIENKDEGDLLTINDDVVEKSTNGCNENNMAVPPPAELMGLYDLLTGASEFEEKSLIPTENSLNSNDDENKRSPVLGWELALFSEPENYNATQIDTTQEVGEMEFWKDDSVNDEINADTQQSVTHFTTQVKSNPFDFQGSYDEQFSMASPNSHNELSAFPNMSSMGDMPYQHLQQQHEQPSMANKKSTNPFEETNMLPSTMPTHPTQST